MAFFVGSTEVINTSGEVAADRVVSSSIADDAVGSAAIADNAVGAAAINGLASVETVSGSGTVTLSADITYVQHTGTGTVTIAKDANTPDGASFNVTTTGTLTMAYPANSQGITLGSSCEIASGVYNDTTDVVYYSETVYS